jgi:hypothetical protein
MQSTPSRETDPHDIFDIKPDVVLAARADQTASKLALLDTLSRASAPQVRVESGGASPSPANTSPPSVDTTFRAAVVDRAAAVDNVAVPRDPPATGKFAARFVKRLLMGLLFALCSGVAAVAWKHHGDEARQMVARWVPPSVLAALPLAPFAEKPPLAAQPNPPADQAAAADQATAPSAPPAQPSQDTATAITASPADSSDSARLLQSMARDLAAMGSQVEQLKADIDQLKAGQAQISRDIAKASEAMTSEAKTSEAKTSAQSQRPRLSAPPMPSAATAARKPKPAFPPVQAAATQAVPVAAPLPPQAAAPAPLQPAPPAQATTQPDGEPVVRPPIPLR